MSVATTLLLTCMSGLQPLFVTSTTSYAQIDKA